MRSVLGFEPSFRTSAPALAASRSSAALAKRYFISSWGRPQAASGLTLAELPHDALTSILTHCHETTLIVAKASCSTLRKACRAVLPAKLRARWPDRPHGRWTIAHDAHVFQEVALARDAWVNAMFDDYEANLSGGANFDRLEELQEENRAVFVAALDYWEVSGLNERGHKVFDHTLICCFPAVSPDPKDFDAVMAGLNLWVKDDDVVRLLDELVEPFDRQRWRDGQESTTQWIDRSKRVMSSIWTSQDSMERAARLAALEDWMIHLPNLFAVELADDVYEERLSNEKALCLIEHLRPRLGDETTAVFVQRYQARLEQEPDDDSGAE